MFDTLLWPFILCLVASSSIVDNIFFWLYRLMPGGRKLANLKANCQSSSIRNLQNAVRGYRFVKLCFKAFVLFFRGLAVTLMTIFCVVKYKY